MKRISRGGAALSGAAYSALVPIAALVFLSPSQYGYFSVPYLIFAFGLSLQLSVVTEAWSRKRVSLGITASWREFWTPLLSLSLAVGTVAAAVLAFVPGSSDLWWLAGLAVTIALARNGARFFDVAQGRGGAVLIADGFGIFLFVGVVWGALGPGGPIAAVLLGWLSSSFVSLLWTGKRLWQFGPGILHWVRGYRVQIRPLVADSLLLDAGSIGTPFLLAPFLGANNFGIYRGISNVSLPVRLLLEPMRPSIGAQPSKSVFAGRNIALVLGLSSSLAIACYVALQFVVPLLGADASTLGALTAFAVPAAVFVLANFVGHYYYIVCRARGSQRLIITGRIAQTTGAVVVPVVGFVAGDLTGAIWGYVGASAASALTWAYIARSATRKPNAQDAERATVPGRP